LLIPRSGGLPILLLTPRGVYWFPRSLPAK
jgi:hypothetical protein